MTRLILATALACACALGADIIIGSADIRQLKPPAYSWASRPTAADLPGYEITVTDANAACDGGGGTDTPCHMRSNGTAWVRVGGGGTVTAINGSGGIQVDTSGGTATIYPNTTVITTQAGNNTLTGYNNMATGRFRPPEATFAAPPSSPATGQVFLFTDASAAGVCGGGGTAKALCRYTGSGYESIGGAGGAASSIQKLGSWPQVTGITSLGHTDVPGVTDITIPAGTITAGSQIECVLMSSRYAGANATLESAGTLLGLSVNGTSIAGGWLSGNTGNSYRLTIHIAFPTTASQTMTGSMMNGAGTAGSGNNSVTGTLGTIDTATTDITLRPRAALNSTSYVDDVLNFDGGYCILKVN